MDKKRVDAKPTSVQQLHILPATLQDLDEIYGYIASNLQEPGDVGSRY